MPPPFPWKVPPPMMRHPPSLWWMAMAAAKYIGLWGQISSSLIALLQLFQFVVITFWAIYAVDRELVFPEHMDKLIPPWLNHIMVCEGGGKSSKRGKNGTKDLRFHFCSCSQIVLSWREKNVLLETCKLFVSVFAAHNSIAISAGGNVLRLSRVSQSGERPHRNCRVCPPLPVVVRTISGCVVLQTERPESHGRCSLLSSSS